MYPQSLDISIDAAYQEAIKQTINSGALDISTEAYNSALALSVGRTSAISSPHRIEPVTDIYLSASIQSCNDICSTPESRPASSQIRSQNNSHRQSRNNNLTTPISASKHHYDRSHHRQRNSDIIARFQRESAHIGGVDYSLLSYSALGTPDRRSANDSSDKRRNQISKEKSRKHEHRGRTSTNSQSIFVERQSAREFLAKLGLTQETIPCSEYEELLSLLLALKHRNFCELNRILSLFPYNAALNSMCASLQSNEVRKKLVDILRPGMLCTSPSGHHVNSPSRKHKKQPKRKSKNQVGITEEIQASQLTGDITEISVSSDFNRNKTAVSTPGLDYYLNVATSALTEPSPTADSSTQTTLTNLSAYFEQSESTGDLTSHLTLQNSSTHPFTAIQDEILSLREMNTRLMQNHDFVVRELDNVTMQLNKEMEKTAKLQALIIETTGKLQSPNVESNKDTSALVIHSSSAPSHEPTQKHINLKDKSVSCYSAEQQQSQFLPIDSIDQGIQALTLSTHSVGTSPHASFTCVVPTPPCRSLSGDERCSRRSTAEFISNAVLVGNQDSEIAEIAIKHNSEIKQRSNSVVNMSLPRGAHDSTLQLSTAKIDISSPDLSPEPTNIELVGSFSSVESMLDIIASYIGTSSTDLKNQITLSYSLAQLFHTGWYDTPCTHLASIALLDIDLFETGEFVTEVPDAIEEFIKESYATSFGAFFVRPYDHSLLTLLLLCVYPLVMFQFAGVAASLLAPILHDVDKSTADEYSNVCDIFSSLLNLTGAVGDYLEKRSLGNLVSSAQTLLHTIKDFPGEIETSCLLPVVLVLARIVIHIIEQRILISPLTKSMIATNDQIYQIFIAILSQILKKITIKVMYSDDEESSITPEQQIALRMVQLTIQTLAPLKQSTV